MTLIWDENKNRGNIKKHGVSFDEAITVFCDLLSNTFEDIYCEYERRFLTIGMSKQRRLLIVSHTGYEQTETIRIISARELTKNERKKYEQYK